MTINELTAKWNSINPYTGGFLLVSGDHPLSFHIGYSNGLKCFMVLDTGKVDSPISSKAVRAECIQLSDGDYALCFTLCHESLDELFVKLCWDLVDSSRSAANPVAKIIAQYNSWRRLFQQLGTNLLSPSRQKGLLGELLYLSEAVDAYGKEDAVAAWVGPEGSDQDFNFMDKWAEAKAVPIAAENVSISSIQQLERSDVGELAVFFMDKTTSHGASTISLPEEVDAVKQKLDDAALIDSLACKLAKYGYFERDAEKYSDTRYRYAEQRKYSVGEGFPKLSRANIPQAVTSAEYTISLAMIEAFRTEE